jgi:DNA-binding MarR family transcriptional regulator
MENPREDMSDDRRGVSRRWRYSLDFDLPEVGQIMHRVYNRAFRDLGVTRNQAVALVYLAEYGLISQTDLARRVGLGKASMGVLIDQMEQAGFVTRQADAVDRRARLVGLGPRGEELIEEFSVIGHDLAERMRVGTTSAERRMVADVLKRIRANLEAIEAGRGDADPDLI